MRASRLLFFTSLCIGSALVYACVGDSPVVTPVPDAAGPDTSMVPIDGAVADTSPISDAQCARDAVGVQGGWGAYPIDGVAHDMILTGTNHIVAGFFKGSGNISDAGLTSTGQQDAFVISLAPGGGANWAYTFGGTLNDDISKLAMDSNGDIYLAGFSFSPTITFGSTVLTNTGTADFGFVAKLSGTDGSVIWAHAITPTSPGFSLCVALSTSGAHVTAGCIYNAPQVTYPLSDGGTGTSVSYGAGGTGGNMLMGAVDPATGGWTGVTHLGAAGADASTDLVTLGQLETTSTGGFFAAGTFDAVVLKDGTGGSPTVNLTRVGTTSNGFVASFDAKGNASWANLVAPADGGAIQQMHAAANGTGGALAVASFTGAIDLGSGATSAAGGGGRDMAIASFSGSGPPTWSKVFGSSGDDFIYPPTTDACGNPAVTLSVKGNITLDGVALPSPQQNAQAPVLLKLDPTGKALWAHGPTPPASSLAFMLFVSRAPNGNLGVGGDFTGSVDIAGTGGTVTQSGGSTNPFLQFWGP